MIPHPETLTRILEQADAHAADRVDDYVDRIREMKACGNARCGVSTGHFAALHVEHVGGAWSPAQHCRKEAASQ